MTHKHENFVSFPSVSSSKKKKKHRWIYLALGILQCDYYTSGSLCAQKNHTHLQLLLQSEYNKDLKVFCWFKLLKSCWTSLRTRNRCLCKPKTQKHKHTSCLCCSIANTFTAIIRNDDKEDDSMGLMSRNTTTTTTTRWRVLRVSPTSRCPNMTGCFSECHMDTLGDDTDSPVWLQSLLLPTFLPPSHPFLTGFITDSQTTTGTLSTVDN